MRTRSIALAAAFTVAAATCAQAFDFTGGNVEGTVFYYTDGSYTGYVVTGSAVADLGNDWGLQFDVGHSGYDGGIDMSYGVGLQVYNQITPEWTLAGFAVYEDWTGSPYGQLGAQAQMMNGPWSFSALVAAEWNLNSGGDAYFLGSVGGEYMLDNGITVFANLPFEEDGSLYPNIGARYGFASGAYVEGGAAAYIYPGSPADPMVFMRVGMDIGNGAKVDTAFWPTILLGY